MFSMELVKTMGVCAMLVWILYAPEFYRGRRRLDACMRVVYVATPLGGRLRRGQMTR